MQDHYSKNHPEKDYLECKVVEKGGIKRFLSSKQVTTLQDDDIEGASASKIVCIDTASGSQTNVEAKEAVEPQKESQSIDTDILLYHLNALKEGQNDILKAVNKSSHCFPNSNPSSVPSCSKTLSNDESIISSSKNIDDLVNNLDWMFFCDADNIRCSVCTLNDEYTPSNGFFNTHQEFRFLKKTIKVHSTQKNHQTNIIQLTKDDESHLKASKKAEEVGIRLGSIAYQIIKQGESLHSFPKRLALLYQTGTFVGNVNHSTYFMDSMLEPFAEVISDKLKMLVSTPLPCTDEKPPIALIDDKSRIKKEDRHGIMVRVPVLKKNVFFKTFLVSQTVQEK